MIDGLRIFFVYVLPWLLVGLACWLTYQLARQNGSMLLRLEGLEGQSEILMELPGLAADPTLPEARQRARIDLGHLDGEKYRRHCTSPAESHKS